MKRIAKILMAMLAGYAVVVTILLIISPKLKPIQEEDDEDEFEDFEDEDYDLDACDLPKKEEADKDIIDDYDVEDKLCSCEEL